ncbi:hypothetical protein ACFV2P_21745, partial [Streptomyces wuyuanensis]
MNSVLDYLTAGGLILLVALAPLLGHAGDRRTDRELRRAERPDDDTGGGGGRGGGGARRPPARAAGGGGHPQPGRAIEGGDT